VRRCLEGILWVLHSGAQWKDLPRPFPSYVTCWRRFVEWTDDRVWGQAWRRLVEAIRVAGRSHEASIAIGESFQLETRRTETDTWLTYRTAG
jgi:transposase